MSYVTVNGRHTFGVVFTILKGRQLRIHCNDSEWSFSTKTNIGHLTNYGWNNYDRNNYGRNNYGRKMGTNY